MIKPFYAFVVLTITAISCSPLKHYRPESKINRKEMEADYDLLRKILEAKHPSLYWYTPKDSMDHYFSFYRNRIQDSMTEPEFTWKVLAPLIDKIRCGHTSLKSSKEFTKWASNRKFNSFPLHMKIWKDSMVVSGSLDKKDSSVQKGSLVKSINGIESSVIIDSIFDFMPEDGYAMNFSYIRVSSNFPYFHRNVFGLSDSYKLEYKAPAGEWKYAEIPLFRQDDTAKVKPPIKLIKAPRLKRKDKLARIRNLKIDSSGLFAIMNLNSFQKGGMKYFFHKSFKELRKEKVNSLILDLRANGGGRVSNSTDLIKYLAKKPFRVADSVFAKSKDLRPFTAHIKGKWLNNFAMWSMAKRKKDGLYHISIMERKKFKPYRRNNFRGDVYILINGPTFSAASLVCNTVKGQPGLLLVGEETGGGWHGNNGIIIPDIKLPHSGIRLRLPLFRVVQYNHISKNGTGIPPDIYIGPDPEVIKTGKDKKLEFVKKLIMEKQGQPSIDR
jgi:hypothetical protein